jgi:hypothetical protein
MAHLVFADTPSNASAKLKVLQSQRTIRNTDNKK